MKQIIKYFEKFVEGILTLSGAMTTIIIILITIFLFKEGFGLFKNPVVEKGYVVAINKANNIDQLSSMQIKDIFDENITNWKEVG